MAGPAGERPVRVRLPDGAERVSQVQELERVSACAQPVDDRAQADRGHDPGLDPAGAALPLRLGVELAAAVDLGVEEERHAEQRQDRRQHDRGDDEDVVPGAGCCGGARRRGRALPVAARRHGGDREQPHHRGRRGGGARRRARGAVEEW